QTVRTRLPRDVRIVDDHPVGNGAAGEDYGSGSPQDPQDVVLRAGQFRGARQLLRLLPQGVGGLEHGEKDALFKGGGRVRRLAPEVHEADNSRVNDYCQEENIRFADRLFRLGLAQRAQDRKSTRLNSSHVAISYAVFCLKKKKKIINIIIHKK